MCVSHHLDDEDKVADEGGARGVGELVEGPEPKSHLDHARKTQGRDAVGHEDFDGRPAGLLGEHIELRRHGEALEVHGKGPGHVRQEVLVQVGVEGASENEAGDDKEGHAQLGGHGREAPKGVLVCVVCGREPVAHDIWKRFVCDMVHLPAPRRQALERERPVSANLNFS